MVFAVGNGFALHVWYLAAEEVLGGAAGTRGMQRRALVALGQAG